MIAHLKGLTRRLETGPPIVEALAVYAESDDDGFRLVPAASFEYEGVACIDDASRAVVLYCRLWRDHRFSWLRTAALRLLRFVRLIQRDDGAFFNFIVDWSGLPNMIACTSYAGGPWWTARAMRALAAGFRTLQSRECGRAFLLGRPWLHQFQSVGALAVAIEAELDYWYVTGDPISARFCLESAVAIANHRDGRILADDSEEVHFWAHHQETALLRVATAFDQRHLVKIAMESAFDLFGPAVVERFSQRQRTLPYEVSCASRAFDAVFHATGDEGAKELAELARAWFIGRNAASLPVYDSARQLTYDGVEGESVSSNSGAESNLEAACSLYSILPWNRLCVTAVWNKDGRL